METKDNFKKYAEKECKECIHNAKSLTSNICILCRLNKIIYCLKHIEFEMEEK